MGAALTYARRYALFTLVGIAGEDDIDAPDLDTPRHPPRSERRENSGGATTGGAGPSYYSKTPDRGSGATRKGLSRAVLSPDQSRSLRDRLLSELAALGSVEAITVWAQQNLSAKSSLTTSDAHDVEKAFQAKSGALDCAEVKTADGADRSKAPSNIKGAQRRLMPQALAGCAERNEPNESTRAFSPYRNHVASGIGITSSTWRPSRVWSAAVVPLTPITSDLPSTAQWDAE